MSKRTTDITRQVCVNILPHQRVPKGNWSVWVLFGGRGTGKSFRLTSWIVNQALANPKTECIAVGRTWSEARSVLAEGPSGIRAYFERLGIDELLHGGSWASAYNRGPGTMAVKLANGSTIHFGSADKPDALRGGNYSAAIADEVAFWSEEAWSNLRLTVRLDRPDGIPPRIVCATTPNGRNWFYRSLIEPAPIPGVVFVGGGDTPPDSPPTTYDNPHLADVAVENFRQIYEGTFLGNQELRGSFEDFAQSIYQPALERHTEASQGTVWPTPDTADEVVAGLDLGSENPSALVVLARLDNTWFVVSETYGPAATPDALHEMMAAQLEEWNPTRIISDSNFPQTTNHLRAKGLPIEMADKRPGSVADGIRSVQSLLHNDKLLIHTQDAPHLWAEMRGYRWATDKNGEPLTPERPVKKDDHALDALRYCLHAMTATPTRDLLFS